MMEEEKKFRTFSEFWPFYVREHADKTNRRLHWCGTLIVIALALFLLATRRWILVFLLPIAGYGFAWFGHFFVQKNRPATFTYPLWSFLADFKMFGLMMTGKMDAEVTAAETGGKH